MGNGPADLKEKAVNVAGILFEMVGIENGKKKAESILRSGEAERKLREIIEAQGGNSKIMPDDIKIGDKKAEVTTTEDGRVLWINNESIAQVAREAGAPKEKGSGVMLKVKLEDQIRKGEILFEIYAERSTKLEAALGLAEKLNPIRVSEKLEERMLIDRVPTRIIHKTFTLER